MTCCNLILSALSRSSSSVSSTTRGGCREAMPRFATDLRTRGCTACFDDVADTLLSFGFERETEPTPEGTPSTRGACGFFEIFIFLSKAMQFILPLSAMYASPRRMKNRSKVTEASQRSMRSGELTETMKSNQQYASIAKMTVTWYTAVRSIARTSPSGIEYMQTAMMMNKLKAADPTIVPGPKAPLKKPFPVTSMQDSRISGAEDPSARSVKFATASFHTFSVRRRSVPFFCTRRRALVIRSTPLMK
mmetsp:Transcript_115613/g.331989  ORF Transcript_115613/g.331989 Transcript_115613/m.331989 type:complete len:248 (+) Transcript_115613:1978-2721(+)